MNTRFASLAIPAFLSLWGAGCSRPVATDSSSNVPAVAIAPAVPGAEPVAQPVASTRWFSRSHPVTLPEGAPVRIRTTSTITTRESRSGDQFQGSLVEPLLVDGAVIAPRGAIVTGLIADSDPGGRVKGRARLGVRLTGIGTASDGTRKAITTNTPWSESRHWRRTPPRSGSALVSARRSEQLRAEARALRSEREPVAEQAPAWSWARIGDLGAIPARALLTFAPAAPPTVEVRN